MGSKSSKGCLQVTIIIPFLLGIVMLMIYLAVCRFAMFKKMLIIISILMACVAMFLFPVYLRGLNVKHESGKDTIEVYGDGTFQISGDKGVLPILVDLERRTTLEGQIKKYKLIGDNLYVQGERGYTIVNIKSEVIRQCVVYSINDYWEKNDRPKYGDKYIKLNKLEDFSQEEKAIFNSM